MEINQQLQVIREGTVQVINERELKEKLEKAKAAGTKLRVKYGADPSAPDIHLGHTVPLKKLRQFQDLGHEVIFIIGDFTAMIGDPSGRKEIRKPLTREQVTKNAETYKKQIFKILDPARTKIVYNSHWLDKLSLKDVVSLTAKYTVARLLERDDFLKRYKGGQPISMVEFFYPLLQGYDSVELKADIELGGTDQTFNLLVAREIQREYGQSPQVVITMPILEGTDGVKKMSKSLDNYIGVEESSGEMYGKLMSISDDLMWRYYEVLLQADRKKIKELKQGHPLEAKKSMAYTVVTYYHKQAEADRAQKEFHQVFSKRQIPSEMPLITVSGRKGIVPLLRETGVVASNGEARRLVKQGGVELDSSKIRDIDQALKIKNGSVLKVGKRHFFKLSLK